MALTFNIEVQDSHHLIVHARKNGKLRIIHDVNAVEWNNYRLGKVDIDQLTIPEDDKKWLKDVE